jgi:hypothetical protein
MTILGLIRSCPISVSVIHGFDTLETGFPMLVSQRISDSIHLNSGTE